MKAVEVIKSDKADLKVPGWPLTIATEATGTQKKLVRSKTTQKWIIRIGAIAAVLFTGLFLLWYSQRATPVVIVQARQAAITETITSSGRVGGSIETNVGSQTQGIVEKLYVEEGAAVVPGQQLALIKNDVAEAQILQAQATVNTDRSQLELASRGALESDIDAIKEQVRQADAQVEQQQAAIVQAQKNVLQTRSLLAQFEAERDLAKKNLDRSASLIEDSVIARSDYDQSLTTFRVADKKVAAQKQAIELAQSGVRSAQASVKVYDIYDVDSLSNTMMALVPYEARPWTADFGSFLTNMQVMGASAYLISAFSLIASAFSIAAVLIVSVLQKSQQIGILKSMGARQSQILRIFVFEGLGVAIFGSTLGAILGTTIVYLIGLLTRTSTQLGKPPEHLFPVQILPKYIAAAIVAAVVTTVIAAVLPARRAAKLNPVDVMR